MENKEPVVPVHLRRPRTRQSLLVLWVCWGPSLLCAHEAGSAKSVDCRARPAGFHPGSTLLSCAVAGEGPNLPVLPFSHLYNGW